MASSMAFLEIEMPMMKRPEKDLENPPGQLVTPIGGVPYNFEKPLQGLVEDYRAESHQESLRDVFRRGYEVGYRTGFIDAQRGYKPFFHLDPNSEEAR